MNSRLSASASSNRTTDEAAIRELVESWARAVRAKDLDGILANHSTDILMFDVPPPVQSKGIEAYRKTWDLFFSWSDDPVVFISRTWTLLRAPMLRLLLP